MAPASTLLRLCPLLLFIAACGGGEGHKPAETARITPKDEIFQVSHHWVSRTEEKRTTELRGETEQVHLEIESTWNYDGPEGSPNREHLEIHFEITQPEGTRLNCRAVHDAPLEVHFGRRHDEPTVEVARGTVSILPQCKPEPMNTPLKLPGYRGRWVLRREQLLPVEPSTERRLYFPAD